MIQELLGKKGFTLRNLHLLLQLEDAGSLVKVAKGDATRQGQYSRQLKELSKCFGVSLAERQGRVLKLTENGRSLARLVREALCSVDDFQRTRAGEQLDVSVGAGDSVLQWLLLPRIRPIQEKINNVHFTLFDLRNDAIAEKLVEQKMDFGIMRETAVPPKHRKERLFQMCFSIFVPRRLLPKRGAVDYKTILQSMPLVRHSPGGELINRISWLAQQEALALNNCLTCEGFPQACRAVQSGSYVAILPTIARGDLNSREYVEIEWPALKGEARWLALAWNPRQVSVRTVLEKVAACLKSELCKAK
jgi:DNA-binding transcriptional LysR family regulator